MRKHQNTFVALLDLLNVKHTNDFSNRYFNEHPHKYNLFGLSKMLSDYNTHKAGAFYETFCAQEAKNNLGQIRIHLHSQTR